MTIRKGHRYLLVGIALAALPVYALGRPPVRQVADVPETITTRPDGGRLKRVDPVHAAAVPPAALAATVPGDIPVFRLSLESLENRDIDAARAARDRLPAGSLDRKVASWAIALSGSAAVSSAEIALAEQEVAGWPGLAALRRNGERALLRENPAADAVLAAFGTRPPLTADGARLLARAHIARGDARSASGALSALWRGKKLEAGDETAILREFKDVIPAIDHRIRMERMLYADRVKSAARVAELAGATELARAWSAVVTGAKDAEKLLDQVPAAQRGAGWTFARAKHLRRAGKYEEAAKVMLTAPSDRAALIEPDAWWVERRVLARELVDLGDVRTAYTLVAAHAAESPAMAADAEFHAGWYALRGLKDAKAAVPHFARIAEIADGPISLARAYYWLGRAAEAGGGGGDADAHYRRAATYGTAFYGQVAAAKVGQTTIPVDYPEPSAADRATFQGREAVAAIRRIEEAGFAARADLLYRELAAEIGSAGELALLAVMAERRDNHYLALRVGKIAASRGIAIGSLAHPTGVIPTDAGISGAGQALAYAIARQESEFNVGAVSGAGARGLLQLMPTTAQDMARKAGLAYSAPRLTSDAGYNATLGATFLAEQLARFDGSYVLTFAGYNAGPRRAQDWMKRYGDPRGKSVEEVVDWIERIPFTETRHYVQRVMENYQVYKMRLGGSFDIARDLTRGR